MLLSGWLLGPYPDSPICPTQCALSMTERSRAVPQQWQALVAGLDPQSLAQYLHNMQLLSADTALDSQGVGGGGGGCGGWQLQRDVGASGAQSLPPYAAQAAARQQLAAMAAGRLDGPQLMGGGAAARVGSPYLEPARQHQFLVQSRQLARLKGPGPGPAWMAAPNGTASGAGRLTPSFDSPRSVDSAPITPAPNQVRRCFSGGNAASSFPTPTFPTPGARFSPQPSPRGGAHRAPTAPLHPSPLAPSPGPGPGLETPLPQSTGTGFFCPAVSATAPRSRGGRSNRQRPRETPSSTTADAGQPHTPDPLFVHVACPARRQGFCSRCSERKPVAQPWLVAMSGTTFWFSSTLVLRVGKSDAAGARRRRGSRRSLESDLLRSAANITADAADVSEPQPP